MRLRVSVEKKFSTAFNQEPEVGVKWKVQRGCRASHALTQAVVEKAREEAQRNSLL